MKPVITILILSSMLTIRARSINPNNVQGGAAIGHQIGKRIK